MIHGYHVIWGTYGFWLPNDPRGSWSDFVYSWELARFGRPIKSVERFDIDAARYSAWRVKAKKALKYPAVRMNDEQMNAVAEGFENFVNKSGLTLWACSILPEHVHLVIARHRYKVEQAVNLLKGDATRRLVECGLHPMMQFQESPRDRLPSVWAENQWKVYLDTEDAIVRAIRYVEENPLQEDMPPQRWTFVTPFAGVETAGWITYH
jgi:REP element-mobilizing transposase RayT